MVDIPFRSVPDEQRTSFYPIENIVYPKEESSFPESFQIKEHCVHLGINPASAQDYWGSFIKESVIPTGYKHSGLHYAGYIERRGWCLPSWIWTNASLVRMYCSSGDKERASSVSSLLLNLQEECGGWIVRNDYGKDDMIPVLAPNDSSYIANNAMLEMFKLSGDEKYLEAAKRCADWIIEVARPDGMVPVGYDMRRQVWQKHNIVDTGFSAALFANLYDLTGEEKYRIFLKRFTESYIRLFYIPSRNGFATSLDDEDHQLGGMFARGQAWALEGLIPAYRVLRTESIRSIIESTIDTLIKSQHRSGGWAYNLTRPLMGEDCKGTPVIAKALMDWYSVSQSKRLIESASKALNWCYVHTAKDAEAKGGIFCYCMEGAVVHHLYSSTAFVYSSAYAIEVLKQLLISR